MKKLKPFIYAGCMYAGLLGFNNALQPNTTVWDGNECTASIDYTTPSLQSISYDATFNNNELTRQDLRSFRLFSDRYSLTDEDADNIVDTITMHAEGSSVYSEGREAFSEGRLQQFDDQMSKARGLEDKARALCKEKPSFLQ